MTAIYTKEQTAALNAIFDNLVALREIVVPGSGIVGRNDGQQILLPDQPKPMGPREGANELIKVAEAEEAFNEFTREYKHRPGDGARAVATVLRRVFGSVLGKATWFQPPQMISLTVRYGVVETVPWGRLQLPPQFGKDAFLEVQSTRSSVYGTVLQLYAYCQKQAEPALQSIFDMVQTELETHSIYKGQAITCSETPEFLDISQVREENVIYAEATARRLNLRLWSRIRLAQALADHRDNGKKIVWLHGDFGTGKSETANLLAKLAVEHGWTYGHIRAGVDSWDYGLQLMRLYASGGDGFVLFVEDAETLVKDGNPEQVMKFLDQLDGIEAKLLRNVLILFTTNYIEQVQKAATRPGRADSIIRLGNLDRSGTERLAKLELGATLADEVDFDRIYAAMGGAVLDEGGLPALDEGGNLVFKAEADLTPAFMRQAFNTAKLSAIVAGMGTPGPIGTEEILDGVNDLQEQLLIHRGGPQPKPAPTLERSFAQALEPMVTTVVARHLNNFKPKVVDAAYTASVAALEDRVKGAELVRTSTGEATHNIKLAH